ncbi:MAG: type VI secretion system tip protein VgrG [Polyangiaceae bacterium]|nr:type VI secretion system tip protein VgrG [Polyangiaceae bacterium]
MRQDLLTLTCSKLQDLSLVGFRGTEAVSRPYEFDLFFTVPVGTAVRSAVGERATLKVDRGDGSAPVIVHGVLANAKLLHQAAERALYQALLVPRLWMLRHFWRSFVFTKQKADAFLGDTLKAGGLLPSDFRFSIDGSYPEEEFVVQYRESHLDFFHRWCEREGLYYYFEHEDGAEGEVLVIVDAKGHHEDFPGGGTVRYFPVAGDDVTAPPALHHLESDVRWLPKTVTIADYNYANPAASVRADGDVTKTGIGTIREYGYRVFDEGGAKRLADVRAQSIGCREVTLRASGTALGPRPGYLFAIEDRPDDVEEKWLALEVEHEGSLAGATSEVARLTGLRAGRTYHTKLFAVPAGVQYRAPQATPWPRIYGFENAVVCGDAESPYAQIDADGRYLVRFEFDTSDLPDGSASTRVRMLQPHGGSTEGFHFPLRKGTEVMIAFLGGDPDRPFISGVVPNAHKPSVVGERNRSQNIIRTGSGNQLVMEDEQGKEFIFLQTPNSRTGMYFGNPAGHKAKIYTGSEGEEPTYMVNPNAAETGDTNAGTDVDFSMWQNTDHNYGLWVGGDAWINVWGKESAFVYGDVSHGYLAKYDLRVGGNTTEYYGGTQTIRTMHARNDTVAEGGLTQNITSFVTQNIHGTLHQTVDTSGWQHVNGGAWGHTVSAKNTDDYGSWQSTIHGAWNANFADGSVTVDATPSNLHIHSAGTILIDADASIEIKSPSTSVKSTAFLKHYLSAKHETYAYKGATGIAKTDHAVIYQSAYGLKLDTVGIKVENEGAKKLTFGMYLRAFAFARKTGAIDLRDIPAEVWNGAFKKT